MVEIEDERYKVLSEAAKLAKDQAKLFKNRSTELDGRGNYVDGGRWYGKHLGAEQVYKQLLQLRDEND